MIAVDNGWKMEIDDLVMASERLNDVFCTEGP